MDRIEKTNQYWQQQEATLQSMFQKGNPQYLDEHEKAEIIGHLPDLRGKKILDLAAGIGRFTRHFSSQGREVVSVDLMPHFIEKNHALHADCANASFLCSDAMDLQFKDHYFDFIFINWLFLYLEDEEIELLLNRVHQWLVPGGELFFRESCDLVRSSSKKEGYFAHYRPPSFYEGIAKRKFTVLKEDYIRTYVDCFADPLQCFWHCKK